MNKVNDSKSFSSLKIWVGLSHLRRQFRLHYLKVTIMTSIKKDFVALVELLQANENKKVSTLLPQILELCTKKQSGGSDIGKTFIKDADDKVVAVFCYYHKKWELVDAVEYGAKANTATGLNTMCKEGTSQWTKAQRTAKKAESELLTKLANGEFTIDELPTKQAEINEAKGAIIPRQDGHGFDTFEELQATLA